MKFKQILGWTAVVVLNGALLVYFHDRFWWPQDDGVFAHLAQRVAAGEVLHKDVQEFRPGYATFIGAAALNLFGQNFVSLRYPLVLAAFVQALIVYALFLPRGIIVALIAATASTALGVLQFLNPNHQWYCLTLVAALVYALSRLAAGHRWRNLAAAFLAANVYLFRQLTGIFVFMGLACFLLLERHNPALKRGFLGGRIIAAVMLAGLLGYLLRSTDRMGFVLIGQWPVWVLVWMTARLRVSNEDALRMVKETASGVVAAFVPLVIYHSLHGSLTPWIMDTVVRSMIVLNQHFLSFFHYGQIFQFSKAFIFSPSSFWDVFNGIYWIVLLLAAAVNGALVLFYIGRGKGGTSGAAWGVLAVFYALVSLHHQIPVYLYFSAGLSVVSVLWFIFTFPFSQAVRVLTAMTVVMLSTVAVAGHAAQPLSMDYGYMLRGIKPELVYAGGVLKNTDLWIDPRDLQIYQPLLETIERHTALHDPVLAVPNNSEIYFMSGRRNPFRFFSTDVGVQTREDLDEVFSILDKDPPKLVTFDPSDKRNTVFSAMIMEHIRTTHLRISTVDRFEVYLRKDRK